jgi:hypothetical protein
MTIYYGSVTAKDYTGICKECFIEQCQHSAFLAEHIYGFYAFPSLDRVITESTVAIFKVKPKP